MPATVTLQRVTGTATLTAITGTTTRMSLADNASPGSSFALQIPISGTNYSFWMAWYLNADTAPAGGIDTVKMYSDGANSFGTGTALLVAQSASYVQATGSSTSGTQLLLANVTGLTPSTPLDFFGYTSASPLSVTGSIGAATGRITNYTYFQMGITSTAAPGVTAVAETSTWQYNEF